jgi:uncharacterized protein (TIGR02265 family)
MSGGTIKGAVLASRLRVVRERFGEDALDEVIGALPEGDRETLRGILLAASWYPMDLQVRLDAAIVERMGKASERVLRELGRESAQDNLPKFQAAMVKGKGPLELLQQTPAIYRLYYGTGRREFHATGPTSGVITTYDADGPTVADCYTIMGWHERALEIVGARGVTIRHPVCRARGGPVCKYELSWTE